MEIGQFLDFVKERRSIRRFKPESIPDEYIWKIIEGARWAMSGANGQPWEFLVVRNEDTKRKLAEVYRKYDEITMAVESTRLEEYRQPRFRTAHPLETPWCDAPVLILVLGDRRTMQASTLAMRLYEHHTFDHNLANATQMIHLSAAALGLGGQWVSISDIVGEEYKMILGIPTIFTVFSLNPIGYPAVKPSSHRRKIEDLVHFEKYDMTKFRSNKDIQDFIKSLRQRHKQAAAYD
jgi:nitroreductase